MVDGSKKMNGWWFPSTLGFWVRTPSPCPTLRAVPWASVPTWTAWASETFRWPEHLAAQAVAVDVAVDVAAVDGFRKQGYPQILQILHFHGIFDDKAINQPFWIAQFMEPPKNCLDNPIIRSGLRQQSYDGMTEVSSPMILPGYAALNKLLGKNVYSSQARPPDGLWLDWGWWTRPQKWDWRPAHIFTKYQRVSW